MTKSKLTYRKREKKVLKKKKLAKTEKPKTMLQYSATGQDVVIWKEERGSRGKMGYSSSS